MSTSVYDRNIAQNPVKMPVPKQFLYHNKGVSMHIFG